MTMPDLAAVASDIGLGRTAASHVQQLLMTNGERRHIDAAMTVARTRWKTLRRHERDLMDWLDETWPINPPADDDWIAALRVYEHVVDVLQHIAQAGKDATP